MPWDSKPSLHLVAGMNTHWIQLINRVLILLQLAIYEDTIGLKKLIYYSIRVSQRMQSCLEETTALQSSTSFHYQPERPGPSEPESEPMQVDSTVYLPLKDSIGWPRICVYTVELEDTEPPHALFKRLVPWWVQLPVLQSNSFHWQLNWHWLPLIL